MGGFSSWTELPQHLLDLVLQRFQSPEDHVRFSLVCMHWNFVAKDHLRRRRPRPTGPPMLLSYSGKEETWNLCDMRNEKVLDLQLELPNIRFCGFSKGWLIFFDANFKVTLVDPFSRVMGREGNRNSMVGLPQLRPPGTTKRLRTINYARKYDFYVIKAIITADPVLNAKDCIIVVIYSGLFRLAFIRLGDTKWTYVDQNFRSIRDIVYIQYKLYAVDIGNRLFCLDITTSQYKCTLVGEGFERIPSGHFRTYLVESSDQKELLLVYRDMIYPARRRGHRRPRITKKFIVYKFDADNRKWNMINSLGDGSLFVGDSVMSVKTSDFAGCLPNCIYFIHDMELFIGLNRHRDYGVYDMTNQDIYHFKDASTSMKMSDRTPMWTMARLRL